jgi:hypothetical protein
VSGVDAKKGNFHDSSCDSEETGNNQIVFMFIFMFMFILNGCSGAAIILVVENCNFYYFSFSLLLENRFDEILCSNICYFFVWQSIFIAYFSRPCSRWTDY